MGGEWKYRIGDGWERIQKKKGERKKEKEKINKEKGMEIGMWEGRVTGWRVETTEWR